MRNEVTRLRCFSSRTFGKRTEIIYAEIGAPLINQQLQPYSYISRLATRCMNRRQLAIPDRSSPTSGGLICNNTECVIKWWNWDEVVSLLLNKYAAPCLEMSRTRKVNKKKIHMKSQSCHLRPPAHTSDKRRPPRTCETPTLRSGNFFLAAAFSLKSWMGRTMEFPFSAADRSKERCKGGGGDTTTRTAG